MTSKLKQIRQKFRQAVDSGRRSGHGRVVLLYFEQCELVWGGSPATETIPSGVESTDIDDTNTTPESVGTNSFDGEDDSFNTDQESVGSPVSFIYFFPRCTVMALHTLRTILDTTCLEIPKALAVFRNLPSSLK